MVFNSSEADAENAYKSMMAKFERRKAVTPPAVSKPKPEATSSKTTTNPPRVSGNGTKMEPNKPMPTYSKPTRAPPADDKPNYTQAGVKRKAEGAVEGAQKKPNTAPNTAPKPAETAPTFPQKGYYAELLKRAAQQSTEPRPVAPGSIVGKKKTAPEPFVAGKGRDLAKGKEPAGKAGVDNKGKMNNNTAADKNTKPGNKAIVVGKGAPPPSKITKVTKAPEKKGPLPPLAATRPLPPLAARNKAPISKSRSVSPPPKKTSKDKYPARERDYAARDRDRDRDRDSYSRSGPSKALPPRRYVYREDSYDDESDSDMEAGGMDILEEEEASARRARLEDLKEERLEKQHAAEKARRKAMLGKK